MIHACSCGCDGAEGAIWLGAAHTGLMSHETMRNVVLEMYELDLKIDERVPKWLLKNVDIFFLSKRAKAQAPYATIENFAKFCDKYPEFIKHALNLQKEVTYRTVIGLLYF